MFGGEKPCIFGYFTVADSAATGFAILIFMLNFTENFNHIIEYAYQ